MSTLQKIASTVLIALMATCVITWSAITLTAGGNESKEDASIQEASVIASDYSAPPNPLSTYRYPVPDITVTDTNTYRVMIPANFLSNYNIALGGVRTSVSGTANIKIYLEQSINTRPSEQTDWIRVDSVATTTATKFILKRLSAEGVAYRITVKGTGTQSSTITNAYFVAKPF